MRLKSSSDSKKRRLQEENALLKEENEILKTSIEELEARLARYENAYAPPSLRRGFRGVRVRKAVERNQTRRKGTKE